MFNNYNNYQINYQDCDECVTKGICSINTTLSSVQEIILLYLKELSFYILRLKDLGFTNEKIKELFINSLFNIVSNVEYNQEQFHELIENLYNYIQESKMLYEKTCSENNIEPEKNKSYFKYTKSFDLTEAMRKGEKYFLKKSLSFSQRQKDFYEIILFLIKSICLKLTELQKFEKQDENAYYEILSLFNIITPSEFSEEELKIKIEESIEIYYNLFRNVILAQIERYGTLIKTDVSFSTQKGHAILVSGVDYKILENVLKAAEGKEINIYTHGLEMLVAHAFPKIKSHPNLKGHFGASMDSSLMDFASFPGPIIMTKGTLQRLEYLYRGRLFTADPIAPPGIVKIQEDNFEPLIKSALETKGFVSSQIKPSLSVGFNENEIESLTDSIIQKIIEKQIKNFYIIGLLNTPNLMYKEYFEEFYKLMPKNDFALALSSPIQADNIFHVDSFFDYPLFYKIISKLKKNIDFSNINITVFITRCDKYVINNLIYLKKLGIKNIYLCKCPPTLINPNLLNTLEEVFGIKQMTTAYRDLNEILKST